MAHCPIRLTTRSVLIRTQATAGTGETGLGQADNINVTSVSVSHVANEISRADVLSPSGTGLPAIQAGNKWNFQLTQELYKTPTVGSKAGWQHQALFEAGPFTLVEDPLGVNGVRVQAASGTCWGVDVKPATVEIVEVGGNVYRSIDCVVENLEISATPNQRVILTWTLSGQFTAPVDSTKGPFTPSSIIPALYRNASVTWNSAALATTCPAFTFGLGLTTTEVETACAGGGNLSISDFSEPASVSFSGALAVKESVGGFWDDMLNRTEGNFVLSSDSGYFDIRLTPAQLSTIAMSEVGTYVGNDLSFQNAGTWELEVDGIAAP